MVGAVTACVTVTYHTVTVDVRPHDVQRYGTLTVWRWERTTSDVTNDVCQWDRRRVTVTL